MKPLTPKEEEVMEIVWQIGRCTPRDVQERYEEPRPHINTIATSIQALERKGYLSHEQVGRGYVYTPIVKAEDYGRAKLPGFVQRYFGNSYMKVVSTFVREEQVSEAELLEFLAKLKREHNA